MKRRWPVFVLPVLMLALVGGVTYAASLGTTYTFEDGTAQGWHGSASTAIHYDSDSGVDCIGYYCWRANLTDNTHQFITTTYTIDTAGVYVFDAYLKRRGYARIVSRNDTLDGYGESENWYENDFDTVWRHRTTYMALITGTWDIGHESWSVLSARTFDHATLQYYGPLYNHAGGLVCDGGFAHYWYDNWDLDDPGGNSHYNTSFGHNSSYGTYDSRIGSFRLYAGDRLTTTIVVPAGAGTLSFSVRHGWNTTASAAYYLYTAAGALVDWKTAPACAGTWCTMSDSWGALAAGEYNLVFDGNSSSYIFLDSVTVSCSNPAVCTASGCVSSTSEAPEVELSWYGAWIYHPYEETDMWSVYQPYTITTWYGGAYDNYNIWRLRPGANVYPLATLDIVDVGVNGFGYYIDSRINAWPDVPSTTVRYEGLASVNVSAGQRINTDCPLGTVGPNVTLGQYHLLLYVEYDETPFNPVPYMTRYPDATMCSVTDSTAETTGPGAGEVPNQFLAVCQTCPVPTTWTNFGRWIAYLWCQIQNVVTCVLAEWANTIIGMQINGLTQAIASADNLQSRLNDLVGVNVLVLGRVVDTGAWMVEPANNGMGWLGGLATDALAFANSWITNVTDRWLYQVGQLENVIMAVSNVGNEIIIMDLESGGGSGTNLWDVLLALVSLLRDLLLAMLQLADTLLDFAGNLFELLLMILGGLTGGLESTDSIDLINFALTGSTDITELEEGEYEEFEIFEFDPGGGGGGEDEFEGTLCSAPAGAVWSVDGPTIAKGACWFIGGAILADTIAFASLIYYVLWAMVGGLIIGLLMWVLGQSPDALKGLFR